MITGLVLLGLFVILPLVLNVFVGLSLALAAPQQALVSVLLPAALLGGCLFGLVKLWPYLAAPTRFHPKSNGIAPTAPGQAFEVKFARPGFSQSFNGDGSILFEAEHLSADGTLEPSIALQLGVIFVVTIIPLVLFGWGLGLIPALLLAYWIGRKKLSHRVPYTDIHDLSVKGRTVTLACSGEAPNRLKFRVAEPDGERLYRELVRHYPTAVSEWTSQLETFLQQEAGD
jgi:hypothetical protein